jgi:tRNA dimethylallyltransferase
MNRSATKLPLLVFLVGPTACGKSDLAVAAIEASSRHSSRHSAQQPAEIINCDSVQFFQGLQIGSAKPSSDLLRRVKHHLVGHLPLASEYTAGEFRRDALEVIEDKLSVESNSNVKAMANPRAFVAVGGSGFYVQALEKGMYEVPKVPAEIRTSLEREILQEDGREKLYKELKERDPQTAEKIASADRYRILRALEILRASSAGETMALIRDRFDRSRQPAPFAVLKVGLFRSRDVLRDAIAVRTGKMLKDGLIEEVENLRKVGLTAWSPLRSVGYREVQAYLDGKLGRHDLESEIVTRTMQLAKRQMTWFKRDSSIVWFDTDSDWDGACRMIASGLDFS